MTWYFKKELPNAPFFVDGKAYRFDIFTTDDAVLANHFLNAAAKRIGGIISIDQAEYDSELKKKAQQQPLSPAKFQREEVRQRHGLGLTRKEKGAGHAVGIVGNVSTLPGQDQAAVPQSPEAFIPRPTRGVLS
jgi:hypothetical protein